MFTLVLSAVAAMKTALNKAISEALDGMKEDERIILDTGDGCAICFLGDPEDAMYVAGAIRIETSKFTDLRVSGLADAGHWLGQEKPQWVNDRIGEFLRSIDY